MDQKAKKIVIITEKVIEEGVTEIIEACGATGYTITPAEGKGSRGVRSNSHVSSDATANVKIEVIVADTQRADEIAGKVAEKYFQNYSGITYALDVEILRPQKFLKQ
ncbi:MAG: hypothetical protein NXI24_10610 [bacterium]|nr:hypothetical protein [bacterium]